MKTKIFYFSGTGNSLKTARDLAGGLGDTELIAIPQAIKAEINLSAERIGLVFPVYMWGVPQIVVDFIKKLKSDQGRYYFAVATCGGMPCSTLKQTAKLFKAQGIKLSAGFAVHLPGNYTPLYGAPSEKTQRKLFNKTTKKIEKILAYLKASNRGKIENTFFLIDWLFSGLIYNFSMPHIHEMAKRYWVEEKCTSCGSCAKVCPVENIRLENGKPQWLDKCEHCLACLQWCPVEAIQFGKSTSGRKRYRHPEIKLNDLFK